jgi:hypothetical protein
MSGDRQPRQETWTLASNVPSVVGFAAPPLGTTSRRGDRVAIQRRLNGYRRHFAHVTPLSRVVADHNTLAGFAAKMGASS